MSTSGTVATSQPRRRFHWENQRAWRENTQQEPQWGLEDEPGAPPAPHSPRQLPLDPHPAALRAPGSTEGSLVSSPGNVLEHKSQAMLPPGVGRGSHSNAAPTTSDPNPFLTPLPCCPSSLSPLAAPRLRNYGCFLALLIFLCFASGNWELWEVLVLFQSHCSGVCSFGVGLGSFGSPGQVWAGAGSPPPAALEWSQIPWERDRNWSIPGVSEAPGKGQHGPATVGGSSSISRVGSWESSRS